MKKIKNLFSSPIKGAIVIICTIIIVSLIALIAFVIGHSGSTISAIGADKAESFALVDAGVDPVDAIMSRTDYSYDNGKFVYEVEFDANGTEYDYLIDAETGAIVKKKQRLDDDYIAHNQNTNNTAQTEQNIIKSSPTEPTQAQPDNNGDIGVDRAKEIALKEAGFTADEVTFKKAKFDHDDGYRLYEIEFIKGTTEYEYSINAANGTVIDFDTDSIF